VGTQSTELMLLALTSCATERDSSAIPPPRPTQSPPRKARKGVKAVTVIADGAARRKRESVAARASRLADTLRDLRRVDELTGPLAASEASPEAAPPENRAESDVAAAAPQQEQVEQQPDAEAAPPQEQAQHQQRLDLFELLDSPARKARKGVKAAEPFAVGTARRTRQSKAARAEITDDHLGDLRFGVEHLELYAALRKAATGDEADVAPTRVVDQTSVARLHRRLTALSRRGLAPNLPADWQSDILVLLKVAPPPKAPYDAYRGE